jgi:predicted DNA-binding transcriptional regulator YafY
MNSEICKAIKSKNKIRFYYDLDDEPGYRTVEPHMIAYNTANHVALSSWYLHGASESKQGPGWREYLLSGISSVTILEETFSGPRQGYNPNGGKKYHNVQCAL